MIFRDESRFILWGAMVAVKREIGAIVRLDAPGAGA
jgi:hypothetical protein